MSFNNTPPTIEQLQAQYAASLELQQHRRQEEDERAAREYELAMVELKHQEDEERRKRESAMLKEIRVEERRREVIRVSKRKATEVDEGLKDGGGTSKVCDPNLSNCNCFSYFLLAWAHA